MTLGVGWRVRGTELGIWGHGDPCTGGRGCRYVHLLVPLRRGSLYVSYCSAFQR